MSAAARHINGVIATELRELAKKWQAQCTIYEKQLTQDEWIRMAQAINAMRLRADAMDEKR